MSFGRHSDAQTEKNATGWSKDKLKSLFEGLILEDEKCHCVIKELTKIEGEASANNRKAKLFFFYEWELTASWKGWMKSGDASGKTYKGTIGIPNLSEEHEPQDVDISVMTSDSALNAETLKEFIRTKGVDKIRQQLGQYISGLRKEFTQGMILPAKDSASDLTKLDSEKSSKPLPEMENMKISPASAASSKEVPRPAAGVKIPCKTLTATEEFKCSVNELYRALTDREMVRAFTHNLAQFDAQKGGKFSLFGGNVSGEFTELVPDRRIEMRWRFKTWPDGHYSNVTLELEQKPDGTELRLKQTEIPANNFDQTQEGWQNYYWKSIKQTFGFGAFFY